MTRLLKATSRILPVLALAVIFTASGALAQQSQPKTRKQAGSSQSGMMSGSMGDKCKQMVAAHDQMMADMKTMDTTLPTKVAAMNAAQDNAKVDAMAAVINEMVSHREQMMAKMSGMRDQMMTHHHG